MQATVSHQLHASSLAGVVAVNQSLIGCMRRAWSGRIQASKHALSSSERRQDWEQSEFSLDKKGQVPSLPLDQFWTLDTLPPVIPCLVTESASKINLLFNLTAPQFKHTHASIDAVARGGSDSSAGSNAETLLL